MAISSDQYDTLLEFARNLIDVEFANGHSVEPVILSLGGARLPAVVPNCFVHVSCGGDCLIYIGDDFSVVYGWDLIKKAQQKIA